MIEFVYNYYVKQCMVNKLENSTFVEPNMCGISTCIVEHHLIEELQFLREARVN